MHRLNIQRTTLACCLLLIGFAATSRAIDMVDLSTFGPTTTWNGNSQINTGGDMEANQFATLGSNPLAPIDRINIVFDINSTDAAIQGVHAMIYSNTTDGSNEPYLKLVDYTFDPASTIVNDGSHKFGSFKNGGFTLLAQTTYWIVLSSPIAQVGWAKTASTSPIYNDNNTAVANPVMLNYLTSAGKWQKPEGGQGNQIMGYALVTAPEPSTYAFSFITASALIFLGRNRRKQAVPGITAAH